jgi:transcriptional regulator of acetoin/glycerol metabolism
MPVPQNPELAALRLRNPLALRAKLQQALADNKYNVEAARRQLGISRSTFFRWLREGKKT